MATSDQPTDPRDIDPNAPPSPAQKAASAPDHDHDHHDHHGHAHGASAHGGHSHGHGAGGGHHHHAPPTENTASFAIGAGVNTVFVIAELIFGILSNSVALVADAIHNLGDVLSLLLAWGAAWLGRRPPTLRRTYGWGRSSILAALINAVVLLISVGAIGFEAVRRLFHPEPVAETVVMVVAFLGIIVNGGSALLFMRNRKEDINIQAQFLHLAGDAAISLGVVIAALLSHLTGLTWLDPVASLLVAIMIIVSTWGVLRESVDLAMDAVPMQIPHDDVQAWLSGLPGVTEVHDLHIWAISTTETALTAHLVCDGGHDERSLHSLTGELRQRFGIGHATLQIETMADAELCHLRSAEVV
jgi:cobalt-zinc-cadmium efflux system protein